MIIIRKVEDKDLIPLSEFLLKVFPKEFETQKYWFQLFGHWWSKNPAYSDQIPRGWIIEKDDAIVSFIGNIPINIMVDGEEKLAAAAVYWYVDPSLRGLYSVRIFNEFIKQKNISVLLFKYRPGNMKKFLSRYNFKECILPKFQHQFLYIIDKKKLNIYSISFILFNNFNRKLDGVSELLRRFGYLMGSWKLQKSLVEEKNALDSVYTCSICTSCDDSFISLHHSNHRNDDIEIFYSVKTLNWLFFSERGKNKRVVIQCKRSSDNSVVGYMVFEEHQHNQFPMVIWQLMDICIESDNLKVLKSLTTYAVEIGKQNNINLLILWSNSPNIEVYFQSADFLKLSIRHYRYFRFSDSNNIINLGKECRNIDSSLIWPPA